MKKIQMVDLKSQYNFIKKEVSDNMLQVFESSTFVNGPMVKAFQADMENYLNVKHVIPCGIYYPVPLHSQKAFIDPKIDSADFPVTNKLVKEVISLPMHSELTHDQIDYITSTVLEFFT